VKCIFQRVASADKSFDVLPHSPLHLVSDNNVIDALLSNLTETRPAPRITPSSQLAHSLTFLTSAPSRRSTMTARQSFGLALLTRHQRPILAQHLPRAWLPNSTFWLPPSAVPRTTQTTAWVHGLLTVPLVSGTLFTWRGLG